MLTTCRLKVCSNIRALDKGKQIHEEVVCRGLHDKDIILGTAFVQQGQCDEVLCGLNTCKVRGFLQMQSPSFVY